MGFDMEAVILSEKPLIRAYLGDCMDLMADKPDGFWDLAICHPPYGIGESNSSFESRSCSSVNGKEQE